MLGRETGPLGSRVREALERILASPDFEVTERNGRFLRYVVEETLEGRADRIKAYSIATCVFGRGTDFDPQIDPIVRIEARRLRRALEHYYLTAGANDAVRIGIPKGAYVATFEFVETAPDGPDRHNPKSTRARGIRLSPPGPSILVAPFEEEGAGASPRFARGFRRHLIVGLTRFTDLLVYGAETGHGAGGEPSEGSPANELDVDFVLEGSIALSDGRFSVEAILADAQTGRFVWADSFERHLEPAEVMSVRDEVADQVVRALASPYGVIYSHKAGDIEGKPPKSMQAHEAVQLFYRYWRTYDRQLFEQTRLCLEETIAREPGYAEAHACLSLLYSNASRFGLSIAAATFDPLERARALAARALDCAPRSSRCYHALANAHWFSGDVAASIEAMETGRALNPNDSDILVELGMRHALLGNWSQAIPLLHDSYLRNPAQPTSYRIGFFLFHYMEGRHEEALREARRIEAPDVVYLHLARLVALARLGRMEEARASLDDLLAIAPDFPDRGEEDLRRRNLHPDIAAAMLGDLRSVIASAGTGAVAGSGPARLRR